ncbi:hypothetical protein GCM10022224_083840 [Nonomuraea antimicrobica]|uniref:DUF4097 domain-containing protein n=1 Tax=Nonomuraea antimicrobica TaxID=561173 RepID=A0ABP7DJM3_9ACTN
MKTIAMAGALAASAVLLTGCGLASLAGPGNEESASYQVTDKVTKLQLKSGSGDAVINETDGTAVRVVETLRWRGDDKPVPEHNVEAGELFLTYECRGNCSVDYEIEVPKGLHLDLRAGSGNLTLRGLSGPLELDLGSGDADAAGLTGKKVFAKSGSGNVELEFLAAPESTELDTGSGDITLDVPDGAYAVKSDMGSGDSNISVRTDASAPNKISITAGSGDVTVS